MNVSDEAVSIGVNGEYTIQAEVTYAGAVVSDAVIAFESLNPDICTVDGTGKIQGLKVGQATIVVSSSYESKLLQKEVVVNVCNNFGLFLEDNEFSLKTTNDVAKGWHSSMDLHYKVMINGEERTDIPVVVTQLSGQDSVSLNGTIFSALNPGEATFTIEYNYEGETVKTEPFKVVVSDVIFKLEDLVSIDITTGEVVIPMDTLGAMIQQTIVDNELQDLIASQDVAKIVYLGQAYTYDEFASLSFNEGTYPICVYLQGSNIGFEIALKFEKDNTLLYLLEENAYSKEAALKYWGSAYGSSSLAYAEGVTDANGESKDAISFENNYWLDDTRLYILQT